MLFKVTGYLVAWLTALVATDPTLGFWSLAWMFPLGLFAFFFPEHRQSAGWAVIILVLALYGVHAMLYFRARTTRSAIVLAGVLVALLVCNVAGCREMIHAH